MSRESAIPPDSHAILIGVSHYQDGTSYPSYPAVANSLRGMFDVLTDPALCGWPEDRVELIADPTNSGQLITRIRRIAGQTTGVLLFYFVGHGVLAENSELCLAISDTDPDSPDTTGLEYSKIKSMLYGGTPAATTIAIVDSCYSGRAIGLGATNAQLADKSAVEGTYTLTAADDTAHVVALAHQATVCTSFTGELLSLIHSGIPGGPAELTLNTLYPHLRQRLEQKNLPRPNQRGTDTATDFVFTRNAVHQAPAMPASTAALTTPDVPLATPTSAAATADAPARTPAVAPEPVEQATGGYGRLLHHVRTRPVLAARAVVMVTVLALAIVLFFAFAHTASNTVTATIPTGTSPYGVAVTPDGRHAYVTNNDSNSVSVIDTASNTVTATIPAEKDPRGVAVTPDGRHAYVANSVSASVSVIDTASNTVTATIPTGTSPRGVAVTPDGRHAYVTNNGSNSVSVIDTAAG